MENMLEYHHCPPGYCQCSKVDDNSEACTSVYYYDDEDDQCVCDREGNVQDLGPCSHSMLSMYNKTVQLLIKQMALASFSPGYF